MSEQIEAGTTSLKIQKMMDLIGAELNQPEYLDFSSYYRHIREFFPKSIEMEEIYGD